MNEVLQPYTQGAPPIESYGYLFWCPGCNEPHSVAVKGPNSVGAGPWQFNGDLVNPTFSPSILVCKDDPAHRCHSFVKDGRIQFLSDSFHGLKNQTVPIPVWDKDRW